MNTNIDIFCSYSHKDQAFLNELKLHLTPLQRQGLISLWNDSDITPGTQWEDEINKHLRKAQIILLLISPDFMASDYCYSIELKQAIERHQRKEARVIPIILRPTHWEVEPLKKLLALPKDAEPITLWGNRDAAYLDVIQGISRAIKEFAAQSAIRPLVLPEQPRIRRPAMPVAPVEDDLLTKDEPVFPIRRAGRPAMPVAPVENDLLIEDEPVFPIRRAGRPAMPITQQNRKPQSAPIRYSLPQQSNEDSSYLNNIGWDEKVYDIIRDHKHKSMISIALILALINVIILVVTVQNNLNLSTATDIIIIIFLLFIIALFIYLYSIIKDLVLSFLNKRSNKDDYED